MSLIHCKECNAEISSEAFDCPKCGAKLREPQRSLFGNLVKVGFIGFNILMLYWLGSYAVDISTSLNTASSEAAKTGTSIGGGLGIMMILITWAVGGGIMGVMMLLTKPKK